MNRRRRLGRPEATAEQDARCRKECQDAPAGQYHECRVACKGGADITSSTFGDLKHASTSQEADEVVTAEEETKEEQLIACKCGRRFEHICIEMNVAGRPKRAWYVNPYTGQEVNISSVILDNSRWIINTGTAELRVVIGFRPKEGTPGGSHHED